MLDAQRNSDTGYITLSPESFNHLLEGSSRPYSVYVFGDSKNLRSSKHLSLAERLKAFGTVGKAFVSTNAGSDFEDKAVFVRLVFESAKDSFGRLGVKGLPYLVHIPPKLEINPGASITLPPGNTMAAGSLEEWGAVQIASFVMSTSGISPGDMKELGVKERSPFLPVFVLLFLAAAIFVAYHLSQSEIMKHKSLYAIGSIVVFWFSVSGGMFNIIRGVPLVGMDPRTRQPTAFIRGGGQMGAEGFTMGTLVVAFGLLAAGFTHIVPYIENKKSRRTVSYGIIVVAFLVFNWLSGAHLWKTSLRTFFYF